jgi:hypothetical protein
VLLAPGSRQPHLPLAIGKAAPVGVTETPKATDTAHPLHIAGQLPILGGQGQATGMAKAVVAWLQLVINSHPLVKNKTLTLPAALGLWHLLQVLKNPPLQMINPLKTLLQEVSSGFLATDATGAKQG